MRAGKIFYYGQIAVTFQKRAVIAFAANGLGIKEGGECLVGGFKKAVSS